MLPSSLLFLLIPFVAGWSNRLPFLSTNGLSIRSRLTLRQDASDVIELSSSQNTTSFQPLFQFANPSTVDKFDRIDDVIMGGVSSSKLMNVPNEQCAKWFGICRTDGGGFCGIRTLPFASPLEVGETSEGFYITCRLVSDDEPQRRVWKMSTRIRPDRGEELYQARFEFTQGDDDGAWSTITVPFNEFRLVRGPRVVPDGPPMNVSSGMYQLGMTMSKFEMSENVKEIDNFREGFFEMQIKEIGVYDRGAVSPGAVNTPDVLSKAEAKKKKSTALKVLSPIAKLFFSEQSQRRKSAMTLLRKRGLSRKDAILFGFRNRVKNLGILRAVRKTMAILAVDVCRRIAILPLQMVLIFPIRFVAKTVKLLKSVRKKDEKLQNGK